MLQRIVLHLVKWYQKYLSLLTPPSCRYYPTCSNYMIMAVKKHGVFLGLIMGIARIIRCNPFVRGGVDFVPDQFTLLRNPHPEQYEDEIIARKFHPPK